MLGTSVTRLRLSAPELLTTREVSVRMAKLGLKRKPGTVGAFERGQILKPDPLFVELYSQIIGVPEKIVWRELRKVLKQRRAGAGPFVLRSVAHGAPSLLAKSY